MIDRKEFTGILKDYDETTVTIRYEDETEKYLKKREIALIRLALIFKRHGLGGNDKMNTELLEALTIYWRKKKISVKMLCWTPLKIR